MNKNKVIDMNSIMKLPQTVDESLKYKLKNKKSTTPCITLHKTSQHYLTVTCIIPILTQQFMLLCQYFNNITED